MHQKRLAARLWPDPLGELAVLPGFLVAGNSGKGKGRTGSQGLRTIEALYRHMPSSPDSIATVVNS